MEACKARSPYTLLGFLLSGEDVQSASSACFSLRDYFARGTNFLLWIALISITFLLCRNLSRLLRLWAHGSRIPGPPSPSFFSGHSSLIAACISARDLTGYLSELHVKYGPIVRLWLGPTQLLVSVKDVEVIKEILINAKDKLPLTGRVFHLAFGRSNVFVSSFEKVQEGREYLAVCMNERLLDKINTIPLKVVDCALGRVESIMSKGTLDCRSISRHISFHILGGTLFEEGFLNWSDATLYEELLLMVFKDACFWASYKVPPFWRREYWRYQYLCTKLKRLTQDIIQHSVSTLPDQSTYKEREITGLQARNGTSVSFANMASGYGFLQEEKRRHLISSEQSFGDILGMLFHGCLTFSNLVCSILTRLVLHPELQMKICILNPALLYHQEQFLLSLCSWCIWTIPCGVMMPASLIRIVLYRIPLRKKGCLKDAGLLNQTKMQYTFPLELAHENVLARNSQFSESQPCLHICLKITRSDLCPVLRTI